MTSLLLLSLAKANGSLDFCPHGFLKVLHNTWVCVKEGWVGRQDFYFCQLIMTRPYHLWHQCWLCSDRKHPPSSGSKEVLLSFIDRWCEEAQWTPNSHHLPILLCQHKLLRDASPLKLVSSPLSLALRALEALPFGSSVASTMFCQVPNNIGIKYKHSSICFLSSLPIVI